MLQKEVKFAYNIKRLTLTNFHLNKKAMRAAQGVIYSYVLEIVVYKERFAPLHLPAIFCICHLFLPFLSYKNRRPGKSVRQQF